MLLRKAKHIQISIPEPCTQGWNEMTPVPGGRHCAQCSKTVTDFTTMTDRELFAWFKNGKAGCGQFYEDQLERVIEAPREPKHSFWVKLALGLAALLGFPKEGRAQDKKAAVVTVPTPSAEESTSISAPETYQTGIQGTVTDEKGEGIPGASVTVRDSSGRAIAITATDVNGEYLIPVMPENVCVCTVIFNSIGMVDDTITNVPIEQGKITKVDHHSKPLSAAECRMRVMAVGGFGIRMGSRMTQPEGVHTVHKMKDWE